MARRPKSFLARSRQASDLTQADLAGATGKTVQTVCNWEGDPDGMQLGDLKQFYHALDDTGKTVFRQCIANTFDI